MNNALQHAEVLIFQATLADGDRRSIMLAEAKDILIRLERLEKGRGAWRLACISALENNAKLCRRWLERARAEGGISGRSALESEPYLDCVRGQKWFKQFLRDLAP